MYPQPSDFRSGAPGSAWVIIGLPASTAGERPTNTAAVGEGILASQWDVILKRFQTKAQALLGPSWSYDLVNKSCTGGTPRTPESIPAVGRWTQATAEALCALLCRSLGPTFAADAADAINRSTDTLPEGVVVPVLAFAFFVTHVGTVAAPTIGAGERTTYFELRLPGNVRLPYKSDIINVQSAAADSEWFAMFDPHTDAAPVPPSAGGARGSSSGLTFGRVLLGVAIAGGVGYALWSATREKPRRNPRRSR